MKNHRKVQLNSLFLLYFNAKAIAYKRNPLPLNTMFLFPFWRLNAKDYGLKQRPSPLNAKKVAISHKRIAFNCKKILRLNVLLVVHFKD